ncbi:MAG: LysR family transcriptional regulator [Planctomycetota bacterium]|jgi:DNA-binding transcriptional LysR family regulator
MNLESAKIFCDLVELKNFSRTAELHSISQSAVSQQLAQLEIAHKVQLINRKKRPFELTFAGQAFYRACKDILERYDQMHNELSTLSKTSKIHENLPRCQPRCGLSGCKRYLFKVIKRQY